MCYDRSIREENERDRQTDRGFMSEEYIHI